MVFTPAIQHTMVKWTPFSNKPLKIPRMPKFSLHSLFIISIAIILNGCVAVIAAGGYAGKEVLPKLKSSDTEALPSIKAEPPPTTKPDTSVKVTPLPVAEAPVQTAPEAKKEVARPKPSPQKVVAPMELTLPGNQLELLNKFPWGVKNTTVITNTDNLKGNAFVFGPNGVFNGFGGCNYFSGKFKASNEGDFLITTLKSSNEACSKNNDDETKIINTLIMADRFQIRDGILTLFSEQLALVDLSRAKDIDLDQLIQKSSNLKRAKQHKTKRLKASKSGKAKQTEAGKTKTTKTKAAKPKAETKGNKSKKAK